MLRLIIPLSLLLGGCASLDDVIGGIANTPEWFQERRVEIRGEGYPDIEAVPVLTDSDSVQENLLLTEKNTRNSVAAFYSNPRNAVSDVTEADMVNLADSYRAFMPEHVEQIDLLLTEAEILALREKVRPPAIKKLK